MSTLARGCLELLIAWLLAGVGLFYVFAGHIAAPGPLWSGVIGGLFVAGGWGMFRNGLVSRKQVMVIENSRSGAMPVADQLYAAIGPAVALHEPLRTPFLQLPCVLYSYELSERKSVRVRSSSGSRTETKRVVYLSGLAMTRWAIETSGGRVEVRGFPVPDQIEEKEIDQQRYFQSIRHFCDHTDFTRVGKWDFGKMLGFAGPIFREFVDDVKVNLWFDGADPIVADPSQMLSCRLIEQAIHVDQKVCVLGKYDLQKGGLVNNWRFGGLQVIPGDALQAIRHLKQAAILYFVMATFSILLGTLGNYGALLLWQRSLTAEQPAVEPSGELVAAFESDDWESFSRLLSKGASPDIRDSVGRPLLLAAIDRNRQPAIDLLLDAGANVNDEQSGWGRRPIEAAFDRGRDDLVLRLRDKGASGLFVDKATGQPLQSEITALEALMHQYSEAIDQSNAPLLRTITDGWPEDFFDSAERGLYRDTGPITWTFLEGYRQDDLATMLMEGRTRTGATERYVITARLVQDQWKLRRQYWDETFSFGF